MIKRIWVTSRGEGTVYLCEDCRATYQIPERTTVSKEWWYCLLCFDSAYQVESDVIFPIGVLECIKVSG